MTDPGAIRHNTQRTAPSLTPRSIQVLFGGCESGASPDGAAIDQSCSTATPGLAGNSIVLVLTTAERPCASTPTIENCILPSTLPEEAGREDRQILSSAAIADFQAGSSLICLKSTGGSLAPRMVMPP